MVGGYLISRENKMYKCECRAWKFQKGVAKNDRTCKHIKELHAAGGAADPRHWTVAVAAPVPSRKHGTAPADSTQTKKQKTSAVDLTADDSNLGLPTAAERTDELFPILSSLASSWGPHTPSISLTNKAAYTDCTVSTPGGSMFAVSWRSWTRILTRRIFPVQSLTTLCHSLCTSPELPTLPEYDDERFQEFMLKFGPGVDRFQVTSNDDCTRQVTSSSPTPVNSVYWSASLWLDGHWHITACCRCVSQ
jgi:hypothetical protein